MPEHRDFRERLREVVERAGRKNVARPDGDLRGGEDESVSQGGLSKILSGERENPGIFTVKAIAEKAGTTVSWLLGETPNELTSADLEFLAQIISWAQAKRKGGIIAPSITPSIQAGQQSGTSKKEPIRDEERDL